MAYEINKNPEENAEPLPELAAQASSGYRVSARPVIEDHEGASPSTADLPFVLPRNYGTQSLWLMARDPHSLFAYWDVDWNLAFAQEMPRDGSVQLRILHADGSEAACVEVEPMAGSCYVPVVDADALFTGELGYFYPDEIWNTIAISQTVATPPDETRAGGAANFATVPFHLSFQRMLDLFRVSKHEGESLTALLKDLRERAASPQERASLTVEEQEIVHALDEAIAARPHDSGGTSANEPDLWVEAEIERVLGLGPTPTSPGAHEGALGSEGAVGAGVGGGAAKRVFGGSSSVGSSRPL